MTATQLETLPETSETSSGRAQGSSQLGIDDGETPPSTAVHAREKWNFPRQNIARLMATFWSFVVSGANDAAYGVRTLQVLWGGISCMLTDMLCRL